jgi:type I restriction enzyme S subunit
MPGHEWRVVELGKVCQARKEIVQPLQEKKSKYVGLEHLDTGEEKLKRFALGSEVRSAKYRFQAGDILYGKLRPYLDKAVIADFGGICSTDMIVISVDTNRADRDYILYSLHLPSFVSYTTSTMTGVNHPRTSWKAISVFRIPLPPLLEQQGIAKVLGTVQRTIEQQDKIIEATKVLKKSLLQKLFREGIGHSEFRETEIGTIPADWDIIKLGDFAVFKNGINFNPKQRGKGTLTVDVLNMYGEPIYINLDKLYRVDISNAKNATDYLLRKGDVLFVRSSLKKEGVGWASLFNGSQEPVTFCGFIIRARVNNANISSEFLTYFLRSDFAREQLVAGSEQVAITNVNQGALRNLKIPFPSLPEQKEIAHCLSTVDRKIEAETKRKATLRKVFRTVRHILITGGIRLKNVEG